MAQGGRDSDEDLISRKLNKLHITPMDESDNYL